ncbi:MAG: hypothetical protein ACOYL6_02145 [Bacteriovoracaceae bacterium]
MSETFQLRGLGRSISRDELEIINFDDLLKYNISPGFIFYISNETKKPFLLLNPGDVVENEFIEKYQNRGMRSFFILKIVKEDNVRELMNLFLSIKEIKYDWERDKAKIKILSHVSNIYWHGNKEGSVLDLVLALNNIFYRLDESMMEQIKVVSHIAFTRSLLMGTIGVIAALCDDINDFELLSDIYHACFLLDYGMMDDDYSYVLGQTMEEERIHPGQGMSFIERSALNKTDVAKFKVHTELSIHRIQTECKKLFFKPEMIKLIGFHHELNNGTGFPKGLIGSELRTLQTIPIFADHIIPNATIKFREKDGAGWFKDLYENNLKAIETELPIKRLLVKIIGRMETLKELVQAG